MFRSISPTVTRTALAISSLLFLSQVALANTRANTLRVDFTGQQFSNLCNGEIVTVTGGELQVVYRFSIAGELSGIHILSRVSGVFPGIGNSSGDEYLVQLIAPSLLFSSAHLNLNPINSAGSSSLVTQASLINLTDPGSGISQVRFVINFVVDGTGFGDLKVFESSLECIGG